MALYRIMLRDRTAAEWTAIDEVLKKGEMGVESDTNKFKFGNGTSKWSELSYVNTGSGGGTSDHALLTHLDKASAGHTGFEDSGAATAAVAAHLVAQDHTKLHAANGDTDLDVTFEATFEKVANKGANSGYCGLGVSGFVDGDDLPALSASKKGGAPATGTPSGKYLKDDGTWATPAGGGGGQRTTRQELTDGANIAWDMDSGPHAYVTLGGNRAMSNPSNLVAGEICTLTIIQDGTGSRTLTWGADYLFPGDVSPTLTATGKDVLVFLSDGTNLYCIGATFDVK